jgi:hypothetical protein
MLFKNMAEDKFYTDDYLKSDKYLEEVKKDRIYSAQHLRDCISCRDFLTAAFEVKDGNFEPHMRFIFPCTDCGSLCWGGGPTTEGTDPEHHGVCINKYCEFAYTYSEAKQYGLYNTYANKRCISADPDDDQYFLEHIDTDDEKGDDNDEPV